MALFPLGRKAREQQLEMARLQNQNQQLRLAHAEIRAKERILGKLFSGHSAQGSMSSELYNQEFPSGNKSAGALSPYRAFSSSSNDRLRRLSRIVAFESPTGSAMIEGLVDIVIGSGLRLQAEPVWNMIEEAVKDKLATDPELQRLWKKNVEQRYKLWSKSLQPSYSDEYNLPQIDRQCFKYLLVDGEYFLVLRYTATGRRNGMTIQIVPPESVCGGEGKQAGDNTVVNGIEYDATGAAVAYHILNDATGQTKRIPRFGSKSGRIFVIHNYLKNNEKQRRGIPYLANVIHELTKLGDYEVLEIQAAIVNALFAVWVSSPADGDDGPVFGKGASRRGTAEGSEPDSTDPLVDFLAKTEGIDFSHGGVIVDALPAGRKVESFDTKRPNAGFSNFFQEVKKNIAAAKRQPLAVVDLAFNNSYSGARGELLIFWMHVRQLSENHGWDFEDDIYEMWMWGEIDRGNVKAPGFDYDELLRKAYCNARWIGNQQPDIDPLKSVTANILEQKYGYRTGHEITAERGGGDYDENLKIVKGELVLVAAANEPMKGLQDQQNQGGGGGGNQKDSGGPPGGGND